MSYLHDDLDDDPPHRSAYQEQTRELTLSTGTILGIFSGLVLLCAIFFGFGYNMGSRAHQAPVTSENAAPDTTNFNSFKPAPGAPATQPAPAYAAPKPDATTTPPPATTSATIPSAPAPIVRTTSPVTTNTPASTPIKPRDPIETTDVSTSRAPAYADPVGSSVVQIAAVSHQEDADLLVSALKRKGYSVVAHTEPQDRLFHIQVGPFASRKDAEAMRQRLLADGYNAIVK